MGGTLAYYAKIKKGHLGEVTLHRQNRLSSFQMPIYQLGHLEHGNYRFAVEDFRESTVRTNVPAVFRILQLAAFNVLPQLLDHLSAGDGLRANHLG